MPNTCEAAGCSDFAEPSKTIDLQKFSEDNESKRNRRRLYKAFVRTKRAVWSPTAAADDFESPFIVIPLRFSLVVRF